MWWNICEFLLMWSCFLASLPLGHLFVTTTFPNYVNKFDFTNSFDCIFWVSDRGRGNISIITYFFYWHSILISLFLTIIFWCLFFFAALLSSLVISFLITYFVKFHMGLSQLYALLSMGWLKSRWRITNHQPTLKGSDLIHHWW